MENMNNLFDSLNSVLSSTDLTDVTANDDSFQELPEGYYLCEVEKAELKESKSSHMPMVALQFKTVEDGYKLNTEGEFINISKTKNRKIFLYYVLKDESSTRRFVTNMLKFEGDEEGVPILSKEYFTTASLLTDALSILEGLRIYIHISTSENDDGSVSSWKNLLAWKRSKDIGLPV